MKLFFGRMSQTAKLRKDSRLAAIVFYGTWTSCYNISYRRINTALIIQLATIAVDPTLVKMNTTEPWFAKKILSIESWLNAYVSDDELVFRLLDKISVIDFNSCLYLKIGCWLNRKYSGHKALNLCCILWKFTSYQTTKNYSKYFIECVQDDKGKVCYNITSLIQIIALLLPTCTTIY